MKRGSVVLTDVDRVLLILLSCGDDAKQRGSGCIVYKVVCCAVVARGSVSSLIPYAAEAQGEILGMSDEAAARVGAPAHRSVFACRHTHAGVMTRVEKSSR